MKKLLMILICFVFVAGAIGVAYAQFAKPEYAIKYRKSVTHVFPGRRLWCRAPTQGIPH
jgi:hypothetical protein